MASFHIWRMKYAARNGLEAAIRDLRLDELTVVYPGERSYALGRNVSVVAVTEVWAALGPRRP